MCTQALWVDVSSGLGRSPPSSYPSREQSAAKHNLGFTAFDKPSNGTGQRASTDREGETKTEKERERERRNKDKKYHIGMAKLGGLLVLFVSLLLQDLQKRCYLVNSDVLLC